MSIVGFVGESAETDNAALTFTTSFADSAVAGVLALSVIPMQYELVVVGLTDSAFVVPDSEE